ncbi:MAG TPA: BlaI/MecI/CopY family transcriptional regulator [Terriglobales bacterium]|nr:BlaI/MecI/CopY family transcriptional regulator [Terriglobales bacterium]
MPNSYEDALRKAQKDLAATNIAAENLERKRAKLRQAVSILQSLMDNATTDDQSLTDAILTAVKGAKGYITTAEVMEFLQTIGLEAQNATVATILSRMVKERQLEKDAEGRKGYRWVPSYGEQLGEFLPGIKKH